MDESLPTTDAQAPGEQTRLRILDAAERLFAERTYDRTSVRDITEAAGANQAAVNYHFGGKDLLYRAVFDRLLAQLREQRIAKIAGAMREGDPTLESLLRAFATAFLEPLIDGADGMRRVVQLMSREMVAPHLPAEVFIKELADPVLRAMLEAMGRVRSGASEGAARLCVLSMVGQLVQLVRMRQMLMDVEQAVVPVSDVGVLVDHVVRFSVAGFEACLGGGESS
ncbi:MAG: hypothetical protein CMJ49_14795 [Planctomycetaceae bacterium]|nr:hypothetical protein [Planctomycetaceae bacterium]